jgi:hypothetical protein
MPRLATLVETRVPLGIVPEFVRAYALGLGNLPPELNQTFLLQSEADPTVIRIHQYWLRGATVAQFASPGYLHACMEVLRNAGVSPAVSTFVVVDRGHPLIGLGRRAG